MADLEKDPDSKLDYKIKWADWLGSDTISTYTLTPDGLTITADSLVDSDQNIEMWVSGGTVGERAIVHCRIVTAGGRIEDQTITFDIVDK